MAPPFVRFLSALLIFLLAAGCAPTAAPATPTAETTRFYPTSGWRSASPESQKVEAGLLAQALALVQAEPLGLQSLLVIRHGYIVSENYFKGETAEPRHELYSVTKSFTSTLIGIAVRQGLIEIHRPVVSYFPDHKFANLDARKQAMTVENLLTMTSGLAWSEGDATYSAMYRSGDWLGYVLDRPMEADPGKVFLYNSGASNVLSNLLNEVLRKQGSDTYTFAQQFLFQPLGITARWDRDTQGIPIGGWGLQLVPRDMAKLGYLYLHEGKWEDQQVIPAEWVRLSTQKQAPTSPGDLGYGYQWWVYPLKGNYARYPAYSALGRYGQTVFVVPDLDLIVVTTAVSTDGHDSIFRLIDRYLVPAMGMD